MERGWVVPDQSQRPCLMKVQPNGFGHWTTQPGIDPSLSGNMLRLVEDDTAALRTYCNFIGIWKMRS
jgi:hypothetical protein